MKFSAEARGLKEKFEAMKAMSAETREHEEYRMRLERAHIEAMSAIEAQAKIAKEQAQVLATALGKANIDIVGGDAAYFDSFVKSLSVGKGIDSAIAKSQTLQTAFKDQIEGKRDVLEDLKQLLGAAGQPAAKPGRDGAAHQDSHPGQRRRKRRLAHPAGQSEPPELTAAGGRPGAGREAGNKRLKEWLI